MKHRALVVEDSLDIAETVTDTLESLSHDHEWAKSQEEARQKIAAGGFTYVLLDLEIPVRFESGLARIEHGENLAREIHQCATMQAVPIIVMTAYGKEGLEKAAALCEHGVVEFINKPFPRTGRTLASVIQAALERTVRRRERTTKLKPEKPFHGGELVFFDDRVELCGVPVITSSKASQMWTILNALKQKVTNDRYRSYDGNALAELVDSDGGQGSIASSIRDFRRNVSEQLGRELGMKVGREDVIETSRIGYRLNSRIVVKDLRAADLRFADASIPSVDVDTADALANERRQQILALVRAGERLRVPGIAARLRCSCTTAKREVDALKDEGKIEFEGAAKTGYYKLVSLTCA